MSPGPPLERALAKQQEIHWLSHSLSCSEQLLEKTGAGVYIGVTHSCCPHIAHSLTEEGGPEYDKGTQRERSTHLANPTLELQFKIVFGIFLVVKATCNLEKRLSLLWDMSYFNYFELRFLDSIHQYSHLLTTGLEVQRPAVLPRLSQAGLHV